MLLINITLWGHNLFANFESFTVIYYLNPAANRSALSVELPHPPTKTLSLGEMYL